MPETNDGLSEAIKTLAAMGAASAESYVAIENGVPYAVVPDGYKLVTLAGQLYNEHSIRPQRLKADVVVGDPDSFIHYWRSFKDANSAIFADQPQARFLAVLDYHEAGGQPRWTGHRCTLQLNHTEEWKIWTGSHGVKKTQDAMAEFIEENGIEIVEPSAASMLEVVSSLQGASEVTFESFRRKSDGKIQFNYREDTKAGAPGPGGMLEVPSQFLIELAVYEGMEKVRIGARLKFALSSGKLTLWYELVRPKSAVRDAFASVVAQLTEACGTILVGKP